MNDYKLINELLEDGSESSMLKLKMIVDFNEFDGCLTMQIGDNGEMGVESNCFLIKEENVNKILNLFENDKKLENFKFLRKFAHLSKQGCSEMYNFAKDNFTNGISKEQMLSFL